MTFAMKHGLLSLACALCVLSVSRGASVVHVEPQYAGMLGGEMLDITGPQFTATDNITCKFYSNHVSTNATHAETRAVYVSGSKARCCVPRLLYRDIVRLAVVIDRSTGSISYNTTLNIILPVRMPKNEHVMAKATSSPSTSWLGKKPSTLTLTWNNTLLSNDSNALVDIQLIGYREANGKGEYKLLATLGTNVSAHAGSYTFNTTDHQCANDDCFTFEIGLLNVVLHDMFEPYKYKYLTSRVKPLGWWVQSVMAGKYGANWPTNMCVDWYNKDRKNTTWLQHILPCPCTLTQALADFGRWQPDQGCSISNKSPDNCFYHKGAVHCVRAVQPVDGAGNQCCYGTNGQLRFAQDTFQGSTPDKSHDWGATPYVDPGFVPSLSHWLTDVVTFYYCCLWTDNKSCDYYMDSRPTKDCNGYSPPVVADVYGQGHMMPFSGSTNGFRMVQAGDYNLLKAGSTTIQGRFGANVFPTHEGMTITTVPSLIAVGVEDAGTSDRIELRLRGPATDNTDRKIDVLVNGDLLEFDDHALAWHDLKGAAVLNTDRQRNVQSNFTVILTNGIGLQVIEIANTLQLDIVVPSKSFTHVSGLLGDLDGNFQTPNGTIVDIAALKMSHSDMFNRFQQPWMVQHQSMSLIQDYTSPASSGPVTITEPPSIPGVPLVLQECGVSSECNFDYSHTGSTDIAKSTKVAVDRLNLLQDYLQPVRSCGLLDIPRSIKSSYSYTLGTVTRIQRCRVGLLSGPTTYTCTATSNTTQAWTPQLSTTCVNLIDPSVVG